MYVFGITSGRRRGEGRQNSPILVPITPLPLSPLQRLLLVNTSKGKKREAGALERENGSAGNDSQHSLDSGVK